MRNLITILLLLTGFSALAKPGITGRITDEKTGEPLIGATIVVATNESIGTVTDVDGNFQIEVAPGEYTLQVKYIGYQTKEVSEVKVLEDNPATLNVTLGEAKKTELSEFVVKSSLKKENINSLYTIQKNMSSISDGISADIIRKSPDRNTGEVLKRVSGTTVQDNKFIVVRGLNERYNTSMLNNAVLPSTQPDRKAFSFDLIPSNLVDNVVIYKSATPDLPGDFAGGAVRVSTKDFPDHRVLEMGIGLSYNSLTTGKDYYTGVKHGSLDFLGFLDHSRDIPSSFGDKNNYLRLTQAEQISITRQFADNIGYQKAGMSLPGLSLNFTSGNSYAGKTSGNKFGYVFSLGFRSSRKVSEGNRNEFDLGGVQLYHYDNTFYSSNANLGGLLNLSYSYGRSKISLKNFFNNEFTNRVTTRTGANYERSATDPLYIKSYSEEAEQIGLFNSVLEGNHSLNTKSKVDWNISYGQTFRNQPDQKIFTFVQDSTDGNEEHPFTVKLNNFNSPAIKDAGRVFSELHESIYGAGANYTFNYSLGSMQQLFRAGFTGNYRSRNVAVTALGYATTAFGGMTLTAEGSDPFSNTFSIAQQEQYSPAIILANIPTNSIDYTGTSTLGAGYVSSENNITANLKAVWGARVEYYSQVLTIGKTDNTKSNTDILPSVNLTYALTPKANLRLSGFQSVNRPEFREFAPYRYYDYDNDFIISGNPDLKRSTSTNIDLRYELYPAAGEIISASLFMKNFTDPIEQINMGNDVLSYTNTSKARVYGIEAEVRKNLGFIAASSVLENFSFYLNAAYIKGEVDLPNKSGAATLLQGQSPYIINTGLSYASKTGGLSANLLYNRIGERIKYRGIGIFDIWESPRDVVDFQIGKSILKNKAEIKFTVSDLFAQPHGYYYKYGSGSVYQEGTDKKINSVNFGQSISLSFRYSF